MLVYTLVEIFTLFSLPLNCYCCYVLGAIAQEPNTNILLYKHNTFDAIALGTQ